MDEQDLSNLMAAYALDALDEPEARGIDDRLFADATLADEFASWQATVAAIAYSAPPVSLPKTLKQRLFDRIAASDADTELATLRAQMEQVTWAPYAPNPGAMVATLNLDEANRQLQCFVRTAQPTKFPKHSHAGDEEIIVLEGDLVIDGQMYQSGDRIYSQPGTIHQPETLNGCVLFLKTSLDDQVVAD